MHQSAGAVLILTRHPAGSKSYGAEAGLLTCSVWNAFPITQWLIVQTYSPSGDGTYSSRYCSGFPPDFLFTSVARTTKEPSALQRYVFFSLRCSPKHHFSSDFHKIRRLQPLKLNFLYYLCESFELFDIKLCFIVRTK